jgi:S-DNA-T family DNA segregation ATPase FtsK/SpoIIIE
MTGQTVERTTAGTPVPVGWRARRTGAVVWAIFNRLTLLAVAGVVVAVAVWPKVNPIGLAFAALILVLVLVAWRLVHRRSFDRFVGYRVRSAWRCRMVYRRRWAMTMLTCGLTVNVGNGGQAVPRLARVRSTRQSDRVTVALLVGQVVDDFAAVADRLAQTFGAIDCRVTPDLRRRERVALSLMVRDPLVQVIAPLVPAEVPDLGAVAVAVGEDGSPVRLRLLGTHVLLVGATGAGKSSVVWALLHAIGPAIAHGLVRIWVVDPKGGMELAAGQPMFTRFCHGDSTTGSSHELAYAELLEDAVTVMRERQARMRGVVRLHTPSVVEPLVLVIVDELAALTAYVSDRDAKRRISSALSLLLSQGRAVGVSVVAAIQDPRKETLPSRDLFPTRVGLRMVDGDQVDMVLGDGARRRGARCDAIPEALPGVAYIARDGTAACQRVRFPHMNDDTVTALAASYPAPAPAGFVPLSAVKSA